MNAKYVFGFLMLLHAVINVAKVYRGAYLTDGVQKYAPHMMMYKMIQV
jgi:hypothetical protein